MKSIAFNDSRVSACTRSPVIDNIVVAVNTDQPDWNFWNACRPRISKGVLMRVWGNQSATTLTFALILFLVLSADGQTFTVLHDFTGGADGALPQAGLTLDRGGNLYGTTYGGGFGAGTIFRLTRHGSNWTLSSLFSFNRADGVGPQSDLISGRMERCMEPPQEVVRPVVARCSCSDHRERSAKPSPAHGTKPCSIRSPAKKIRWIHKGISHSIRREIYTVLPTATILPITEARKEGMETAVCGSSLVRVVPGRLIWSTVLLGRRMTA